VLQFPAFTQAMADSIASQKVALDTIWVMVAAFLVFFMNLGFALVESGFCRSKNTVNILFKNFVVFAVSSLVFLVLGYFGTQPPSPVNERFSQIGTLLYFAFFLLMPWWSRMGEFKPVPSRVTFAAH